MLAGIYKPTRGRILFDDVAVNDLPPQDRHIGMVFQSYALYPHMSVFDNIAFPLRLQRRPPAEILRRVREVAGLVQIDALLDRRPAQLSGGQQQRVALARALVKEPMLLLLDEPLSNLDAKLRVLMRAEIKRLQRTLGITTILVTHDQVEAMTMADHIAVLRDGALQQVGTPDDLYYRPANTFVAGFIGTPPMSLLTVRIAPADGRLQLEGDSLRLPVPDQLAARLPAGAGGEITLGLRPEDVELTVGSAAGQMQGTILDVEPLGREIVIAVTIGGQVITVLTPHGFRGAPDQQVSMSVGGDRIYLFDPDTGTAIA
jgi:ABC-type sugar transport system ATPase subunit